MLEQILKSQRELKLLQNCNLTVGPLEIGFSLLQFNFQRRR